MFQTTNQNISIHCWSILTATEIPGLADWPKEESWPTRWLVGGWPTPLENDGLCQLGWLFHSQWIWKVIKFHGSKPPTRWSIQVIFQKNRTVTERTCCNLAAETGLTTGFWPELVVAGSRRHPKMLRDSEFWDWLGWIFGFSSPRFTLFSTSANSLLRPCSTV